jgi:hypothetical protein
MGTRHRTREPEEADMLKVFDENKVWTLEIELRSSGVS